MTKSQLITLLLQKNVHLYQRDVEKIVDCILDEIIRTLSSGGRVELRGLGAFSVKCRAQRTGRNPKTGQSVKVGEKYGPAFKLGKEIHRRLNPELAA